jgi:hypothetical protein
MPKKIVFKLKPINCNIQMFENISMELKSNYLLKNNKEKVANILKKANLENIDRNEIIDVYVGLHLILEIGINNFFREIIVPTFKKNIDKYKMIKDIDNICFSDKITMFVYYSKFNFLDIPKATEYQKIIGKTKHFGKTRNWLLHGHIISSTSTNGKTEESDLFKELTIKKLNDHISDFIFIMKGIHFYIDSLDQKPENIDALIKDYLDFSFLP